MGRSGIKESCCGFFVAERKRRKTMSLDVYLEDDSAAVEPERWAIFIREDGQQKEITLEEWNKRYPGRQPVLAHVGGGGEIYTGNVTHNLGEMAEAANLYKPLWTPEEIGITKAEQLIEPLTTGLAELRADPDKYKPYNPENGWGSYDVLVLFVEDYLAACEEYPNATVRTWR
jgi:hypothetical protein